MEPRSGSITKTLAFAFKSAVMTMSTGKKVGRKKGPILETPYCQLTESP
jgi:hypothetical protein